MPKKGQTKGQKRGKKRGKKGAKNTWKRRVEQVPLMEPAKKAFTIGLIPAARSSPDIVVLVTHSIEFTKR